MSKYSVLENIIACPVCNRINNYTSTIDHGTYSPKQVIDVAKRCASRCRRDAKVDHEGHAKYLMMQAWLDNEKIEVDDE